MPSRSEQSNNDAISMPRFFGDKPLRQTAALFALTLAVGTTFFGLVERWRWLDALYFCMSTVTMLGYGDIAPQTDFGKVGTMIYAVVSIAIFLKLMERLVLRPRTSEGKDVERATDL